MAQESSGPKLERHRRRPAWARTGPRRESAETLVEKFLHASAQERRKNFADTARAAEFAGVSRRTIQNWIQIGEVRAVRLGRKKYFVHLDSLVNWLKELHGGH